MRIKSKEIADILGISPSAVSRALNGKGGVSEETRKKVLALINEKNSTEFAAIQKTENLPIIIAIHKKYDATITSDASVNELLKNIEKVASANGYPIQILNYFPGQDENAYFNYLQTAACSGIILFASELSDENGKNDIAKYKALGKPIVAIFGQFNIEMIDYVSMDNTNALFRAVKYAYLNGHRKVGYLQSKLRITSFETMYTGFLRGMRVYKLDQVPLLVYDLPLEMEDACKSMKQLLRNAEVKRTLPSIFIAETDYIAMGAMRAFRECGYSVPEDISFIGNGDVPECRFVDPQLTSVQVNHGEMGRLAAKRLIEIINNDTGGYLHMQITAEIVERSSVANRNEI